MPDGSTQSPELVKPQENSFSFLRSALGQITNEKNRQASVEGLKVKVTNFAENPGEVSQEGSKNVVVNIPVRDLLHPDNVQPQDTHYEMVEVLKKLGLLDRNFYGKGMRNLNDVELFPNDRYRTIALEQNKMLLDQVYNKELVRGMGANVHFVKVAERARVPASVDITADPEALARLIRGLGEVEKTHTEVKQALPPTRKRFGLFKGK